MSIVAGEGWKIYTGDAAVVPASLDGLFDGVFCDAPYGLSFMGKKWDVSVPSVELWSAIAKVSKPGAPLLCFGGTRTYHRLAVAIEDAGFEIRDCLAWIYGSGFPKSLNVSKAIDRANGDERPVIGTYKGASNIGKGSTTSYITSERGKQTDVIVSLAALAASAAWDGYGTALKPAWEICVCAEKPLDLRALAISLLHAAVEATCQLRCAAKSAAENFSSNQVALFGDLDSAQWSAVERCSTPADLFGLMDTSRFAAETPLSLSIAWSWLAILGDLWRLESTFTTETKSSLTTDLRTLNSSPSKITPESIIEAASYRLGLSSSASLVDDLLSGARARLALTQTRSALDAATSRVGGKALRPDLEPCVLARKPLEGAMAANVVAHGVGGLNIDGARVGDVDLSAQWDREWNQDGSFGNRKRSGDVRHVVGRWPANVILDEEAGAVMDAQSGNRPGMSGGGKHKADYEGGMFGAIDSPSTARGDTGGASRFFYTAKANRFEREFGCDALPNRSAAETVEREEDSAGMQSPRAGAGRTSGSRNHHPTVKPISLAKWLATLILPPPRNGSPRRLLVPFSGSGSEMIGALRAGWDEVVGIELDPAFVEIASHRLRRWEQVAAHLDPEDLERAAEADERQTTLFGDPT